MKKAHAEIVRIENLMTSWRDASEIGQINVGAGHPVKVSDETIEVLKKSRWAGDISEGVFDVTFHALGDLWKFGDAAEQKSEIAGSGHRPREKELVDYRKIKIDAEAHTVTLPAKMKIDLGGIAKGLRRRRRRGRAPRCRPHGLPRPGRRRSLRRWTEAGRFTLVSGIQDREAPAETSSRRSNSRTTPSPPQATTRGSSSWTASATTHHRSAHGISRDGLPQRDRVGRRRFTADAVDDAVFILGPRRASASSNPCRMSARSSWTGRTRCG